MADNDKRDTELMRAMQQQDHLPLHAVFAELADLYHQKNPGTRNLDLAALLGTRPQAVSQWKSGSDARRRPPWSAVLLLAHLCRRQVLVHPAGIKLQRIRPWKHDEASAEDS